MKKRLLAIICAVALLIPVSVFPASAATNWASDSYWTNYTLKNKPDYSFAVLGDIQFLTSTDVDNGHHYTRLLFDWILNNKDSRNIQYVFGLGDTINTLTSWPEDGYSTSIHNPAEWELAANQFARFNGVIPYMVVRGNHDDEGGYHKYICTTDYKNQMSGFFYDSSQAAKDGNSMSNSFRKITIGGEKYLMLGLDYNIYNNSSVRNWANAVISANPDHTVIVSIHAYYTSGGALLDGNIGEAGTNKNDGNEWTDFEYFSATKLWNEIFSKHANIAAILCGHAAVDKPIVQTRTGNNGNKVIEILVNPQDNDEYRQLDGIKRCGFVLMLNFSNSGKTMEIEYISTIRQNYASEFNNTNKFHLKSFQDSSSVIQTVTANSTQTTDWESVVKDLGIPVYVGAPMTTSPKLDGVVDLGEYSYSNYHAPDELLEYDSSKLQGGVKEFIAHDADYIYYAISVVQDEDDLALQWQFNPFASFGIFNDKTDLKTTLFQRVCWQLRYQSDGTIKVFQSPTWNYDMVGTLPVIDTDLTFAASKTEENVKTYEIRLSKDYLAKYNLCEKEDIKVLPYMTHQHSTSAIAHNYTQEEVNTLKSYGATRAETGIAPLFMIFEEDPRDIEYTISISTQDKASVRISSENAGLRFKTSILKSDLEEFINKFGAANVSIGTLIAPTDKLGDKRLTHSSGIKGTDYVEVMAAVDQPFADTGDYLVYAGSLSRIKQSNLGRDFTAVGFIAYKDSTGTHYIYSDFHSTRNIDYVAAAALKDTTTNYTSTQKSILEKLTLKYYEQLAKETLE
ncbi:MAG: metallophosphoesterase [Clostridia bacterium]|nr:metallophosphoesterase [Clostridia bacterium]